MRVEITKEVWRRNRCVIVSVPMVYSKAVDRGPSQDSCRDLLGTLRRALSAMSLSDDLPLELGVRARWNTPKIRLQFQCLL